MLQSFHRFRTNPKIVDKTPVVAVSLLELANVQQLYRMWTEYTAAGQSLYGWVCVNVALILWLNFYLVFNRQNKFAIYGTAFGILMNASVIASVIFFRYFAS